MTATQRRYLIGIALLVTVAAAVFAPDEAPPEVALAAARPVSDAHANAQTAATTGSHGLRYQADAAPIFTVTSWQTPKPQSQPMRAVVAKPEAPQAPPVPFRVLGKFVENGVAGVFVMYNDRTLAARAGERLTEEYEVASITDQIMTVRYLPLNVTQDVSAGGSQ